MARARTTTAARVATSRTSRVDGSGPGAFRCTGAASRSSVFPPPPLGDKLADRAPDHAPEDVSSTAETDAASSSHGGGHLAAPTLEYPATTPELVEALRHDREVLVREALLWQRWIRYVG